MGEESRTGSLCGRQRRMIKVNHRVMTPIETRTAISCKGIVLQSMHYHKILKQVNNREKR